MKNLLGFLHLLILALGPLQVHAMSQIDSGRIFLESNSTFNELSGRLLDNKQFVREYLAASDQADSVNICDGWADYVKFNKDHIALCVSTERLGYEFVVLSHFNLSSKPQGEGQGCFEYILTLDAGTRPGLLLDNVHSLRAEFCLSRSGRMLTYKAFLQEGTEKGMLFSLISREFKKFIPAMVQAVQNLSRL